MALLPAQADAFPHAHLLHLRDRAFEEMLLMAAAALVGRWEHLFCRNRHPILRIMARIVPRGEKNFHRPWLVRKGRGKTARRPLPFAREPGGLL